MLWVRSTRTRTESRSTAGVSIGAAAAISTQENPAAAAAPASAAEDFRKSRRSMMSAIWSSGGGERDWDYSVHPAAITEKIITVARSTSGFDGAGSRPGPGTRQPSRPDPGQPLPAIHIGAAGECLYNSTLCPVPSDADLPAGPH